MSHLAAIAFGVAVIVARLPASEETAQPQPLTTTCQCITVTCSNGGMSPACVATCPAQAVCSCAYCTDRGRIISGQNSCYCQ